jgi:hypothetical protein
LGLRYFFWIYLKVGTCGKAFQLFDSQRFLSPVVEEWIDILGNVPALQSTAESEVFLKPSQPPE